MRYLFTILFLVFSCCLYAQKQGQERIDSLLAALYKSESDTSKIRICHHLFLEYKTKNLQKAEFFAREGLRFSKKNNLKKDIANAYLNLGRLFADKNRQDSAVYYYKKSIAVSEKINNYEGIASNYVNIGSTYFMTSNWIEALNYYNKALQVAEIHNYPNIKINALSNIAGVYFNQKDYTSAKEFMSKAYEIDKNNTSVLVLDGLSQVSMALKDTTEALKHLAYSMASYEKKDDSIGIAQTMINMALLEKNNETALSKLLFTKDVLERVNPDDLYAVINLGNIGNKYYLTAMKKQGEDRTRRLNEARKSLLKAIDRANKLGMINYNVDFLEMLVQVEEASGNYHSSLLHTKEVIKLKDSLYSQDIKNEIAQNANQYELSLRDKQIEVNELALKNSRNQQIGLVGGIFLLTTIGGLLYYQNRLRKKQNTKLKMLNTELDQANRIKTRFFSILNHDLRSPVSNLIHFLHLKKENPDLLDEETKSRLEQKTTRGAEDLLVTMEDLLLWSKGQMENFEPLPQKISVEKLFEDTKKVFSGYQHIQFEYHNSDDVEVFTDENYLKTIIRNLTSNAINVFTTTEKPHIVWKASQEGEQTVLSITDNGPGADSEKFRALYDESTAVGIKSGLGLHLIRDLAKAIGCEIEVDTTKGKGTEIKLLL